MKRRNQKLVLNKIVFQLIFCLLTAAILMINGLLAGNYLGKLQNWLISILKAYRGPYLSFVFFGTAVVILIVMVAAIIDARRQAVHQAEIEKSQALTEKRHAEKLVKLNQELHLANEQLEERNKSLSELDHLRLDIIGAMQHDLNHILGVIQGGTESLIFFLQEGDLDFKDDYTKEQAPATLQYMKDATLQLAGIVRETLNQAKTQLGEKFTPKMEKFNLVDLINSVLRFKESKLTPKKIKVETQFPDEIKINADNIGLLRVFTNLIDNAAKYSPQGTKIIINIELTDKELHCRIIDQGIGIPAEYLKEIFKMYSRVKSEDADKITEDARHGIGLFSCKNIIEAHEGKIWVESEGEGKGSTFAFTLPI